MSRRDAAAAAGPAAGHWLWLFPTVFAAHIAEECLAGERFYRWIRRATGREWDPGLFVAVNLVFEVAMIAAVRRATRAGNATWVAPALGLIGATNGFGHLAGSMVMRSYPLAGRSARGPLTGEPPTPRAPSAAASDGRAAA